VNRLLNPAHWLRALTQPVVLLGLAVDLLPIYGVFAWGWGALPLVMLYWMENIVAGIVTIPRIVISGASFGGWGLVAGLGLSAFFVLHYGLFCSVHGTFLVAFSEFGQVLQGNVPEGSMDTLPIMDVPGMFMFGLNSGLHVDWMLYAVAGFQFIVLIWEFFIKGEWKDTNPMAEMFAPYGRIIVLHLALFAGAAALFLLGQPLVGVLALIVLRALFGIVQNSDGVFMDGSWNAAMEKMGGREQFEKALRGERID
jgi:hypothetical protein